MKHNINIKRKLRPRLRFLLFLFVFFIVCLFRPLSSINYLIQDYICRPEAKPGANIFVIGIDDKSLKQYGPWNSWPRSRIAGLIELLNSDPQSRPAVIGIDVMYYGSTKEDGPLFEASSAYDNLVFASELSISSRVRFNTDNTYSLNHMTIDGISLPQYPLSETSRSGFTNVLLDSDGMVRHYLLQARTGGSEYHNFAYEIYRLYTEKTNGQTAVLPAGKTDIHRIPYSASPGGYGHGLSFCDVMEGLIPSGLFKDSIVIIGAYASGMMDSYYTPADRGTPMYGAEINANIVQAFCEGKYAREIPLYLQLLLLLPLLTLYNYLYKKQNWVKNCVLLLSTIGYLLVAAVLARLGYILDPLYPAAGSALLYIYRVIKDYVQENKERLKTLDTFRRYVSPEIARVLLEQDNQAISEGGTKRHIAVLFVDIRGFTPLSEKLPPEAVANVLNEYLTLTSSVIFSNGGTVDKFIGDATMALFNAPADLEDYVYRSVKTAWEIIEGSSRLNESIFSKYGVTIQLGIGVNCGEAVVGSIGAAFRMDYTAIGDTVNTAARLESNAAPGQILISPEVYALLKERISAVYIGKRQLKGKAQPTALYQVISIQPDLRIHKEE